MFLGVATLSIGVVLGMRHALLTTLVFGVAVASGLLRARPTRSELAVAGASMAVVWLCAVWDVLPLLRRDPEAALYAALVDARGIVVAWALVLWLPARAPTRERHDGGAFPAWTAGAMLLAAIGALVIANAALTVVGTSGFTDEALYIFQSRLYEAGQLRAPLPEELQPFLAIPNLVLSHGMVHVHYTPGWPFVLAILHRTGLLAFPWIFGAATLVATLRIATRIGGVNAGVLAVFALATNVLFLRWSSGYLAHGVTAACIAWMAVCLVSAEAVRSRWRWALLLAGGFLGSLAFTIRPLTALALGAAVWAWFVARSHERRQGWVLETAALALGAIVPAACFLWVNDQTNGSPFALSYTAAHAGGHSLGFAGERIRYDVAGQPFLKSMPASPALALQTLLGHLAILQATALPIALAVPLVWSAWRAGLEIRRICCVFLALPFAYLFWSTVTIRSMTEVAPFIAIGLGLALSKLWRAQRSWAGAAIALIAGAAIITVPLDVRAMARNARKCEPYLDRVAALAEAGPTLVFVNRGSVTDERLLGQLWWFNAVDWMGRVIVARDLGPRNRELIERYPSHTPYVIAWRDDIVSSEDVEIRAICDAATARPSAECAASRER